VRRVFTSIKRVLPEDRPLCMELCRYWYNCKYQTLCLRCFHVNCIMNVCTHYSHSRRQWDNYYVGQQFAKRHNVRWSCLPRRAYVYNFYTSLDDYAQVIVSHNAYDQAAKFRRSSVLLPLSRFQSDIWQSSILWHFFPLKDTCTSDKNIIMRFTTITIAKN